MLGTIWVLFGLSFRAFGSRNDLLMENPDHPQKSALEVFELA